jgi:hypothetical protein
MPVKIEITLDDGQHFLRVLEDAGLLRPDPRSMYDQAMQGLSRTVQASAAVTYRAETDPATGAGVLVPAGVGVAAAEDIERPGETVIVDMPPDPPKRTRGRPKGTTATVMAERAAAETPPASAPGDYVVRRYGGQTDSEHATAKSAMARLVEMIGAAGDVQALDELVDANGDLIEALRTDDAEALQKVVFDTRATLAQPEPVAAPAPEPEPVAAPAPAGPVWPFNQANETITSITPNENGARDAVWAIACGQPPKFGGMVAMALLERHGVSKLSEIPSGDDPRWAKIAVDGAGVLGLPVAGITAPAAGGLM